MTTFFKAFMLLASLSNFSAIVFADNDLLLGVPEDLKIVKSSEVCMVKNYHYGTPQTVVEVMEKKKSKTFYACCLPCKKALLEDPTVRWAKDPLTGEKVDKSTAVIAADYQSKIYYFKNQTNFDLHTKKKKKKATRDN